MILKDNYKKRYTQENGGNYEKKNKKTSFSINFSFNIIYGNF